MLARPLLTFALAAGLAGTCVPAAADDVPAPAGTAAPESYTAPPSARVRDAVREWVTRPADGPENKDQPDGEPRGGADLSDAMRDLLAEWDGLAEPTALAEILDLLERTLRAGDARIDSLLAPLDPLAAGPVAAPDVDAAVDSSDPFVRDHARLLVARALVRRAMYDEALSQLESLDPADVADPAAVLFLRAVCHHQLQMREEAVAALDALDRTDPVPEPTAALAALMRADLKETEPESLREIAGLMRDVERRLDLGRSGDPVRTREQEIVDRLDELIDKLQQQANSGGGGGGQQPRGGRAQGQSRPGEGGANPAGDSELKGGEAEGATDPKNVAGAGGWGDLPPKEQAKAKALLDRSYPGHYGRVVEQYFRKTAEEDQ